MSQSSPQMPPARRRPIPGMSGAISAPPPPQPTSETDPRRSQRTTVRAAAPATAMGSRRGVRSSARSAPPANRAVTEASTTGESRARERRPAADYASTRLVNFRIPVDLHDRFRVLVREAEQEHPRLRRPSLTEVVIALLEEGPQTTGEVAELIRRKRAAEHAGS